VRKIGFTGWARTCRGVVLVVVLELLGGHGLAKVKGECVEDIVLGAREGVWLGHLVASECDGHGCLCRLLLLLPEAFAPWCC